MSLFFQALIGASRSISTTTDPLEIEGQFSPLVADANNGWQDYSDGNNTVNIVDGVMVLEDSSGVVNDQTKARTTQYFLPYSHKTQMVIKFMELNDSTVLDTADPEDNENDGYTESDVTTDAAGINYTGLSFAYVDKSTSVRTIFAITKSIDYDTTGKLEIWKVNDGYQKRVKFVRVYSGTDIPMNKQFTLDIEYERYDTTILRGSYYLTLKVNGKLLVNREITAHDADYGGLGSWLFQAKGTDVHPIIANIYKVDPPTEIFAKVFDTDVINSGVISDTSADVLARLSSINSNGDCHVVMLGTQDAIEGVSTATFKSNLTSIVQGLNGDVILCTPPPVIENEASITNATLNNYISKIIEVANEQSIGLVDIYSGFQGVSEPTLYASSFIQNIKNRLAANGVYLTYRGAEFTSNAIMDYMVVNNLNSYNKIVCVGDGITYGVDEIGVGTSEGQTYPARLKAKYDLI